MPVYNLDTELNAPATPSSSAFGEPMNTKGPDKLSIEPEAMISSPLRAVKFLTPPMRPLLCLIICAIFVCLFYFINTLFFV